MRVKSSISGMVLMIAGLIALTGLIYGCYSREVVPENKNIYGRDIKPNPPSDEELRKFAGSIRKVDGEAEAHYRLALHFQEKVSPQARYRRAEAGAAAQPRAFQGIQCAGGVV